MNGKLARALRKQHAGRTLTSIENTRADRHARRLVALAATGPKFPKARKHKRAKGHGPTWPLTADQRAQGRPVTVLGVGRALVKAGRLNKYQLKWNWSRAMLNHRYLSGAP